MPLKPSQPTEATVISSLTVESLKFSKAKRKVLQTEQVIKRPIGKSWYSLVIETPTTGMFFWL